MSQKSRAVSFWIVVASFVIALSLPAQTFSRWRNAENLGPDINTSDADSCLFVTPSGLSLYFASTRPGGKGALDMYVSQRATTADPWGAAHSLGDVLNSEGDDHLAFITPDGHSMIFASTRAGGLGGNDLYISFRRNASDDFGWEAPQAIAGVNTAAHEFGAGGFTHPRTGLLTLYFCSDRAGGPGGYDIYSTALQADGTFSQPEVVPEINASANDSIPSVRADGLEMFFSSTRPGGFGAADIYTSTRASVSDPWSAPVNVGEPVNSSVADFRAGTFGSGTELYFFSPRPGGVGGNDLYRATRSRTTIIPIAGSTSGANGQVFKTTAQLSNPGAEEISGRLVFHPAGVSASAGDPELAYTLAPYESQTIADLMAAIGVTGVGSIEIIPESDVSPASAFRIENGGSMVVPPADAASVLYSGMHSAVKMPSDTNRFRMNVGIRTFESGATIWICMHDPDGTFIRGDTHVFPPNYLVQLPVADLMNGAVTADQMVMFTVNGGSAMVVASTVANGGHASTIQVVRPVID